MSIDEIRHRLPEDLRNLSLPVDEVDLFFRPYSVSYYGRYFPVSDYHRERARVFVYPFADKKGNLLPYSKILDTAIHELCHHIQYVNGFTRVRGVMHNTQFWKLYNHYTNRARKKSLLPKEVC